MKATVILKSGLAFDTIYDDDHQWSVTSLTDQTIHRLVGEKQVVIVQGNEISYIVVLKGD